MSKEEFNTTEEKAPSEFQKLIEGLISPVDFVSRTDFNTINWNGLPDDKPQNQGRTLAWQAFYLAVQYKPALLDKLLACSPDILEKIDWNACPQDEKNPVRGETVAWMLGYIVTDQPASLEKLLACSPVILEKIDWNACPLDENNPKRGTTIFWMLAIQAMGCRSALFEKLLAASSAIPKKIGWNACPRNEEYPLRGVTVALLACNLAYINRPALLEKLLACSPDILEKIDWNACNQDEKRIDRGETVALMACSQAYRDQPALLDKLLACPPAILEKIDWNAGLLNEKRHHRGSTVFWWLAALARKGQSAPLEKLLACSPAILEKINWNACPQNEKNLDRGFTVALQACTLAFKGKPALLEKLFSRSSTILENIDWYSKHFKLIGNTPPVSLLSRVFTQNNARLFFLLLEWSGPALQNLKTALLSSGLTTTDTTRQPLFCWIDFSLLVNSPKKPAMQGLLLQLDEEEKGSGKKSIPDADEIAKFLQNIKKVLPDLYGRACLHTGRQWPSLRQRFYPDIPPASPDYGTAQWELANMYLNEQDEKETPAKRELGLKEALSAASRCWYHEIRMSPDQTKGDGRLLVRIIVKAILGWPPGELTCDLPGYVESLLKEDAQYYTTHRHDLRPHELDLKINNLWLSLKIFLIEERHAATMKSITEFLKNQPGYLPAESLRREPSVNNDQKNIVIDGIPNQSDQNGTGQNKKRKVLHQTNLSDLFPSPRLDVFPGNSRSSTALSSSHSEQPTELNRYKGITNE